MILIRMTKKILIILIKFCYETGRLNRKNTDDVILRLEI